MLRTRPCRQFFFEQYQQLDEELFSPNRAVFPADRFNYTSFSSAVASVRSKLHAPLDADPVALVPLADAVRAAWTGHACALAWCSSSSLYMIAAAIRMPWWLLCHVHSCPGSMDEQHMRFVRGFHLPLHAARCACAVQAADRLSSCVHLQLAGAVRAARQPGVSSMPPAPVERSIQQHVDHVLA
jgi:hypothetical protein